MPAYLEDGIGLDSVNSNPHNLPTADYTPPIGGADSTGPERLIRSAHGSEGGRL